MGIITKVKLFAKNAVDSVNNGIATASKPSTEQISSLENQRQTYLSEYADKKGGGASVQASRNMAAVGIEVYQSYLRELKRGYRPIDIVPDSYNDQWRIRYLGIERWVIDTEEKNLDKLVNVYEALSGENCNIALIVHRGVSLCEISIGVVNTNDEQIDPAVINTYYNRLVGALNGNFPGALLKTEDLNNKGFGYGIPKPLKNCIGESVSLVSNIATEKSDDFISQSLEKLLDGFVPQCEDDEYTLVLIASPIKNIEERKARLYELYTALAPYSSWTTSLSVSESETQGNTFNLGASLGIGFSQSDSTNVGLSIPTEVGMLNVGKSHSNTMSENFGVNFSRSTNVNVTLGKNETLTQTFTNYAVKHTLEEIEKQVGRIDEAAAVGNWDFSAYILSKNPAIANNVAHMYLALTQGDNSNLSSYAIEVWDGEREADDARIITKYIGLLQHPYFCRRNELEEEWKAYPTLVTPATSVSGKELAKALNFPTKSVSGVPVLESVTFGREPHAVGSLSIDIALGQAYHMRKVIPTQKIGISKDELRKHTFVTGSTGSGKSTTIYKLLEILGKQNVHFMVVEPAKGEYKLKLGKEKGVNVYVTNPNMDEYKLLRINPFSFPQESTHILEHLDRLVEIFNVCWPMYAAMPAVLKEAIERAYIAAGWDLEKSTNKYCSTLFPTFADVETEVRNVLNDSDYSEENKGDYIGALVTRIHSLTNGINGLVFCSDALSDYQLFDQNAIVDLSRVGSSETKSLIMGLLVIKMQEYRMQNSIPDSPLHHVTVLEEAHNLLRNTTVGQSGEGSNMQAKSVEMLSNAIAEMRTYGEGFIIADQSPGLLDMSVMRNTNTKIILRLPDASDRELVGKAAGLNEKQVEELSRLDVGVAAISQSGWLEPVLCKVDLYSNGDCCFDNCKMKNDDKEYVSLSETQKSILDSAVGHELTRNGKKVDIISLRQEILKSRVSTSVKCDWLDLVENRCEKIPALKKLLYNLFNAETVLRRLEEGESLESWCKEMEASLPVPLDGFDEKEKMLIIALLVSRQVELDRKDKEYLSLLSSLNTLYSTGGVIK